MAIVEAGGEIGEDGRDGGGFGDAEGEIDVGEVILGTGGGRAGERGARDAGIASGKIEELSAERIAEGRREHGEAIVRRAGRSGSGGETGDAG